MSDRFPVVDLAPWYEGDADDRAAVAAVIDAAFSDWGFVLVTAHRVSPDVVTRLRAEALAFFSLPPTDKAPHTAAALGTPGWIPVGMEANAYASGEESPPDLKESLSVPVDELAGWPDRAPTPLLPTARPALLDACAAWIEATNSLQLDLLRIGAAALGLDEDFFAARCGGGHDNLYLNWYPQLELTGAPAANQFRIGPHQDFGTLTVLDRQPGVGGLQVQLADGSWHDAPYVPGALTVNVGDQLALWSGRWRSAMHRVLPPSPDAPAEALLSLIQFCEADDDVLLAPLPGAAETFEPIRAGDYLRQKLAAITVAPGESGGLPEH